jgi:hypothetical protein
MFPHADSISKTMSPRTIVTGVTPDFATHCRVPIGACCEAQNENDPSNTETPRTSHTIALGPTGNLQGSYRFLSLDTGKRVSRRCWTKLPITDDIIARLHALALAEQTYDPNAPKFLFEWAPTIPIADVAKDIQVQPQMIVLDGATHDDTDDDDEEEKEEDEEENGEEEENEEDEGEEKEDTIVDKEAQEMPEESTLNEDDKDEGAHKAPNEDEGAQGAPNNNEEVQGAPNESDEEAQGA